SKDCSWISSSLTVPPVQLAIERSELHGLRATGVEPARPPRFVANESISSMKPIAPPSLRAVAFRALKYFRILRAVIPYHIDWNAGPDTNRKGTPACFAIAFARCVLPVPGGPSKRTPRRGLPPSSRRKVA